MSGKCRTSPSGAARRPTVATPLTPAPVPRRQRARGAASCAGLSPDDLNCPHPSEICRLHSLRPWGGHLVVVLLLTTEGRWLDPARDRSTSSSQLTTRRLSSGYVPLGHGS